MIVAEIHAIREEIDKKFDYDLDAIVADLQRHEDELRQQGWTFVDRSKKTRRADSAE